LQTYVFYRCETKKKKSFIDFPEKKKDRKTLFSFERAQMTQAFDLSARAVVKLSMDREPPQIDI